MKQRIIALIRLFVTLVLIWCSTAQAIGADIFDIVEVLSYTLNTPTVMGAYGAAIWAWWKNNNMTRAAQSMQPGLDEIKAIDKDEAGGEGDPLEVE